MRVSLVLQARRLCWFDCLRAEHPRFNRLECLLARSAVGLWRGSPDDLTIPKSDVVFADMEVAASVARRFPESKILAFSNYDQTFPAPLEIATAQIPQVRMILKASVYSDPALYRAQHFERLLVARYLGGDAETRSILRPVGIANSKPPAKEELDIFVEKVRSLHLLTIGAGIQEVATASLLSAPEDFKDRPIDIVSIGTGGSYWCASSRIHRERVYRFLRDLDPEIVRTIGLSLDDTRPRTRFQGQAELPRAARFRDILSMSKICASPYGYSELSLRDYEGAACGAVVAKPFLEHILTFPGFPYCELLPNEDGDFHWRSELVRGLVVSANSGDVRNSEERSIWRERAAAGDLDSDVAFRLVEHLEEVANDEVS